MRTDIKLQFLKNSAGEAEGLSDAGIETFRGSPYLSVARETAQNSRDAIENKNSPVILKIDKFQLKTTDFPKIESFKNSIKSCLDKSICRGVEKDTDFFKNAFDSLNQEYIDVLSIQDFNTIGVRGPCEEGQPFHALVKADGVSSKANSDSGGSFGIGKSAVFALSNIQTVFYSTKYQDDDRSQSLFMGKSLFISHKGMDGEEYRRTGYLGFSEFQPIDQEEHIPKEFQRTQQGTSIFSICARQSKNWSDEVLIACLINFFTAIHNEEMQFEIDNGSIKLNKYTLETMFNDPKLEDTASSLKIIEQFKTAKKLYKCLIDNTSEIKFIDIKDMGQIKVHLLLGEKIGYTVGIVRNGMYITNNLSNFGESFKRFPLYREFVALIEPNDKQSGEWFKRVENPSHDSLSAERITDENKRKTGNKIFTELAKKIRSTIKEFARPQTQDSVELDELNEFFSLDNSEASDLKGLIKKPFKHAPTKINKVKTSRKMGGADKHSRNDDVITDKSTESDYHSEDNQSKTNDYSDRESKKNNKLRSEKERSSMDDLNERNILSDHHNKKARRIFFNSAINGQLKISIYAAGLSTTEKLSIVTTDMGKIINSDIYLDCKKNSRNQINLEFETEYIGPIELRATYLDNNGKGKK